MTGCKGSAVNLHTDDVSVSKSMSLYYITITSIDCMQNTDYVSVSISSSNHSSMQR